MLSLDRRAILKREATGGVEQCNVRAVDQRVDAIKRQQTSPPAPPSDLRTMIQPVLRRAGFTAGPGSVWLPHSLNLSVTAGRLRIRHLIEEQGRCRGWHVSMTADTRASAPGTPTYVDDTDSSLQALLELLLSVSRTFVSRR